jgi:DNA-binding NarL/FixJ family response regulator
VSGDAAITILIVDDHPVVRAGLRALLDRDGLHVVAEASSGEEAIDVACRLAPDVVLMDYGMRGMDGVSATRALLRRVPSARVILLVTLETEREIARGLSSGAVSVVTKDVSPKEMIAAVRAAAPRQRA